jgi:hypothetical protein
MSDLYCPMIHGGLNINLKQNDQLSFNQCCLSTVNLTVPSNITNIWNNEKLIEIRDQNNQNVWNKDCWECERLENAGLRSFRQGMIDKFGIKKNLSGPQRIDLLFDRSCNLACVTCGPGSSTLWQKHLKEHKLLLSNYSNKTTIDDIFKTLKSLDLSNLELVQFCGGETLLGNTYWDTADFIANLVPDCANKIDIAFQTNGTQSIDKKHFNIIEKFRLVKFFISLDSTHNRFEYLRWPASWNQVTDNIMRLREELPVNVMFSVQEVVSCLNMYYYLDVPNWLNENFKTNRLGDSVDYSMQLAIHKHLDVNNVTQEYVDAIAHTPIKNILRKNWKENPENIKNMLENLKLFDSLRNKNWQVDFPEVAQFYSRYL